MDKNILIGLVVVALIAIGAYFFPSASAALGAACNGGNCTDFDAVNVLDGFYINDVLSFDADYAVFGAVTTGGDTCTLTDASGGAYTLSETELENCSVFKFAAGGAGQAVIALTAPATSTLSTFIETGGQCRTYLYDASALAAATTTTFTTAAGVDVIAYTTNDDVIDGGEYSQWSMCRNANTDIYWVVSELVNAD
jgi:hypothetical protein